MSIPFSRAPHIEGVNASPHPSDAPNAALLIDFDNVTMGMRSDLSKELKALLGSDVIKGKVTVQRAYADWRRYPQYIVPLSEASVDLIFAPAYGSNKKNATDIRMAIDGIELVFTRPEIGTYILLTGDSDFSSLVLKLKEYGKYVIGVGIQESSSNILVQNCDEYYSYTSLSGLTKSEEGVARASDPWGLVSRAAEQMGRRGDVMRSDRLKQVMLDIDSTFDEKSLGFSKFSRFVSEASRKGLIEIRRMENGQYEIVQSKGGKKSDDRKAPAPVRGREKKKPELSEVRRDRAHSEATVDPDSGSASPVARPSSTDRGVLESAYALLREAISELLTDMDDDSVRDSDVKRRMLALQQGFSEADLGFPKFSRFLRQAHDHGVVDLRKSEGGNYQVVLGTGRSVVSEASGSGPLRPSPADADPLLERKAAKRTEVAAVDPERLRLPTDRDSIVKYLSNSYGGVGKRTAETLVDALGDQLFRVLHSNPSRVGELLPPARAERVLAGWKADFQRRSERHAREGEAVESGSVAVSAPELPLTEVAQVEPRARRGRRTRGGADPKS